MKAKISKPGCKNARGTVNVGETVEHRDAHRLCVGPNAVATPADEECRRAVEQHAGKPTTAATTQQEPANA